MSERPAHAAAADTHEAVASSILVWNGLATRLPRIGIDRLRATPAHVPAVQPREDEQPTPSTRGRTSASS